MRDAARYLELRQNLLPQGALWSREPDRVLTNLLAALAEEDARVDGRGVDVLAEADPRTAVELLAEWEALAGLPTACRPLAPTIGERQAFLAATLTEAGGQSRAFFLALAIGLGWPDVWLVEHGPFQAGTGQAGGALTNGAWRYVWDLAGMDSAVVPFRAGSGRAGDPIRGWGDPVLECEIRRRRPAHTRVRFLYLEQPSPEVLEGIGALPEPAVVVA